MKGSLPCPTHCSRCRTAHCCTRCSPVPKSRPKSRPASPKHERFVKEFDPDLIINFGPDHYNGFFYNLMPPFCVGYEAFSIGDFGSQAGPLDVPYDLAQSMAQAIIDSGVDTAISLHMEVDHGAIQPVELIYGDIAAKPIIPVFVNAVSKPFTPIARIRALGQAIGTWAADPGQEGAVHRLRRAVP